MDTKIDFKTELTVMNTVRKMLKKNIAKGKKDKKKIDMLMSYITNIDFIYAMISEESSRFKRNIFNVLSLHNLDKSFFKENLDKKIDEYIEYYTVRIVILSRSLISKYYEKYEKNVADKYFLYLDSVIRTFLESIVSIVHLYIRDEDYDGYRDRLIYLFYTNLDEFYGLDFPSEFIDDDKLVESLLEAIVTDDSQEELKDYYIEEGE